MTDILFVLKTPPPMTGAAFMNERIMESKYLDSRFTIDRIRLSYTNHINDLGSISIIKILKFIRNCILLLQKIDFQPSSSSLFSYVSKRHGYVQGQPYGRNNKKF